MVCLFKKGLFVDYYFVKKVEVVVGSKKLIKIWLCCLMILFDMVGIIIVVYNGKNYILVFVNENMVGYKFGEFVIIWIFKGYGGDKKLGK